MRCPVWLEQIKLLKGKELSLQVRKYISNFLDLYQYKDLLIHDLDDRLIHASLNTLDTFSLKPSRDFKGDSGVRYKYLDGDLHGFVFLRDREDGYVITLKIDNALLDSILKENENSFEAMESYLVLKENSKYYFLTNAYYGGKEWHISDFVDNPPSYWVASFNREANPNSNTFLDLQGNESLVSFLKLNISNEANIALISLMDKKIIRDQIYKSLEYFFVFVIFILLTFFFIYKHLFSEFSKGSKKIVDYINNIANGKFEQPLTLEGYKELESFSQNLNKIGADFESFRIESEYELRFEKELRQLKNLQEFSESIASMAYDAYNFCSFAMFEYDNTKQVYDKIHGIMCTYPDQLKSKENILDFSLHLEKVVRLPSNQIDIHSSLSNSSNNSLESLVFPGDHIIAMPLIHEDIKLVMVFTMSRNLNEREYSFLNRSIKTLGFIASYIKQKTKLEEALEGARISESKLLTANHKLKELSRVDNLTGAFNKAYGTYKAEKLIEQASMEGKVLSIVMFDIDQFKMYNDFYGHLMGDKCLSAISQKISSSCIRNTDLFYRFGGEEFVIILQDTDTTGAAAFCKKLQQAIEGLAISHEASDVCEHVTLSIGAYTTSKEFTKGGELKEALALADKALYRAKQHRNTFVVC